MKPGLPPLAAMRPNAARLSRSAQRTTKAHEGLPEWGTADYADWSRLGAGCRRQDCQNNYWTVASPVAPEGRSLFSVLRSLFSGARQRRAGQTVTVRVRRPQRRAASWEGNQRSMWLPLMAPPVSSAMA